MVLTIALVICRPEYFKELGGKVSDSTIRLRGTSRINPNLGGFPKRGEIDLRDLRVTPEMVEEANQFHQRYEEGEAQRKAAILSAYEELGRPMVVVTMFYCNKFVGLFENWLKSCKDINVRKYTIAFCLDKEAYDRTRELGVQAILEPKMSGEYKGFGGAYGKSFGQAMFYKNAFIYDLLRYLPCNILFQDTDLIWFKDPLPYLSETKSDVAIMYDGPNPNFMNIYANTGFYYLKNNERVHALIETALCNTAYIFSYGGHQKPFDRILDSFERHGILTFEILPENLFANGHLRKVPEGAYVYHYSWTANMEEKLKKLEKMDLIFNPSLFDSSSV